MRIHLALLVASLPFIACHQSSPTEPKDTALSFETVAKTYNSGFLEARREIIRSSGEWASVWQTLYASQRPIPELPAIDFEREMAVLSAAGNRNMGCFDIDITEVTLRRNGQVVEVQVNETVPGPACVCTQAQTQPVHVVKVERVSGHESFIERRQILQC